VLAAGPRAGGGAGRAERVSPRKPRPAPKRAAAPAPVRTAPASTRRRNSRPLVALISLLVIVLVIIAAVLISAPATTKVTLRNVVYSDVHQASESLQKLVSENTK